MKPPIAVLLALTSLAVAGAAVAAAPAPAKKAAPARAPAAGLRRLEPAASRPKPARVAAAAHAARTAPAAKTPTKTPAAKTPAAKPPAAKAPARAARPAPDPAVRTEALFVTPPQGWVVAAWQGGTVELGAFTPEGQTEARHVELMGYSLTPRLAGRNDTEDEMRAAERERQGCRSILARDHAGEAGWYDSEYLCLGPEGAPADTVEVEFASTRLGRQTVLRIWRSWRGSPSELSAMLKERFGVELSPVKGSGAEVMADDQQLEAAFAALAPAFFADTGRREVCDLAAPQDCAGLHGAAPDELRDTLPGEGLVAGFLAPAQHRVSREDFRTAFGLTTPDDGSPNRVISHLRPTDPAWIDARIFQKAVLAVGMGQAADGGALYLMDRDGKLDAAARTRALARLLAASRQLWRPGRAPDTVMVLGGPQPQAAPSAP